MYVAEQISMVLPGQLSRLAWYCQVGMVLPGQLSRLAWGIASLHVCSQAEQISVGQHVCSQS